ncbi:hypothetical protein [Streptomyces sp. SID12488]|uniref:hypothetical protein n=1 Tax=Streptomyces sp. SID12488 TaxID=2706040 RepID=UPI001EF22AE2|nr:hypothetical protein [Streptomyces sp. SID12488]
MSEAERADPRDVLAGCPEWDTGAENVRYFGEALAIRLGSTLPAWINAVDASRLPASPTSHSICSGISTR